MNTTKLRAGIVAAVLVGLAMMLLCGCNNEAQMKPGSRMILADDVGHNYLVQHDYFEVYRVTRLPDVADKKGEPR